MGSFMYYGYCIETIAYRMCKEATNVFENENNSDNLSCIKDRYLLSNIEKTLETNSVTLSKLAENIESELKDNVMVERKHTNDRKYLAGITIDYRHLKYWKLYKYKLEPSINVLSKE